MSAVIADTLAAHRDAGTSVSGFDCSCGWSGWNLVAHQAEALAAAGVGDLRGLLDDLRGLADEFWVVGTPGLDAAGNRLSALLDRYASSDPTPKEQP